MIKNTKQIGAIIITTMLLSFAAWTQPSPAASLSPGNEIQQTVNASGQATPNCLPMTINPFLDTCGNAVTPRVPDLAQASPRETSSDYKLATGDCMLLDFSGDMVFSAKYCVAGTGNLMLLKESPSIVDANSTYFVFLNQTQAQGLTIEQFKKSLDQALADKFRNKFTVTISLNGINPFQINILGAVRAPGLYRVDGASRLTSALLAAGGPLDFASIRQIKITRSNGTSLILDLYKFFLNEDPSQNIYLEADDTIFIPIQNNFIITKGQFLMPGKYELLPSENYSDLLRYALGYTNEALPAEAIISSKTGLGEITNETIDLTAGLPRPMENLREIFIPSAKKLGNYLYVKIGSMNPTPIYTTGSLTLRQLLDGKISPLQFSTLNLSDIIVTRPASNTTTDTLGRDSNRYNIAANSALLDTVYVYPGDTIYLTDFSREVFVTGAVKYPAATLYRSGLTVNDYILLAGGPADNAKLGSVRIQRRQNTREDKADYYMNIKKDESSEFTVLPGDIIFVPNRSRQSLSFFVNQIFTYSALFNLFAPK